jgi:hypothetical protein
MGCERMLPVLVCSFKASFVRFWATVCYLTQLAFWSTSKCLRTGNQNSFRPSSRQIEPPGGRGNQVRVGVHACVFFVRACVYACVHVRVQVHPVLTFRLTINSIIWNTVSMAEEMDKHAYQSCVTKCLNRISQEITKVRF